MGSQKTELNELALALAHWLEAAQALADDAERRLACLEEARARLARSRRVPVAPVRAAAHF